MSAKVFSHWLLLILPFSLFLFILLTPVTIFSFGSSLGVTILLPLLVVTVWRTIKKRIHQWTKNVAKLSADRNAAMMALLSFEQKKEEDLKELFRKMENIHSLYFLNMRAHQEAMSALETQLEMTTSQAQEAETLLQNKLAQEKALLQETEAKLKETNLEWEEKELSYRAQIKELLQHLARAEKDYYTKSAELKRSKIQERIVHQDELETLQRKLEMMTIKMEEKETTMLQKLAEEETRTAQANRKFADFKEDLIKVSKERQHFLKNEVKHFQGRAEDNLRACRDAESQLAREKRKTADLQRRLDAVTDRLAQCSETSYWALDSTAHGGGQTNSQRSAVDRHRQEPTFRGRRGRYLY